MVDQADKKQQATEDFAVYLSEDASDLEFDWQRDLSDALKNLAVKYAELSPAGEAAPSILWKWHDYFVMGLKKFVRDLPSNNADLEKALAALNRDEVAAEARARGVHIQILPEPPAPVPVDEGDDNAPKAPAPLQNVNENANAKRPAENQAEGKSSAATEAQDRQGPAKRVKYDEAEDATTSRGGFTLETEGSLTFRISDDTRTSTFNLNGRGPAVVTVNVQKKATTALASTNDNGNKEAEKEGAA